MLNLLFGLADFDLRGGDTGAIAIADLGGEIGLDAGGAGAIGVVVDWIDACRQGRLGLLLDRCTQSALVPLYREAPYNIYFDQQR